MLPSLVSHIKPLGVPHGASLIWQVQSRTRDGLQGMKDEPYRREGDGEEEPQTAFRGTTPRRKSNREAESGPMAMGSYSSWACEAEQCSHTS